MMDFSEYDEHVKELKKFVLEQVFTIVTDKEVVPIGDDQGFMAVMRPKEAQNAIVMMGQLQEQLLAEMFNILAGLRSSGEPDLVAFSDDITSFVTKNITEMLEGKVNYGSVISKVEMPMEKIPKVKH